MVAEAVPPKPSDPSPPESDAVLARRAQILATEHWGLLAARGTAQSEVLTRITIFLTLVSAGLVTIGLLGQATGFTGWFAAAALSILAFLAVVGLLTQVRVLNVAQEDMMFVTAMNRLRGAYVDLDPKVEEYLLESTADDRLGMQVTYSFMAPRSDASHMAGSSMFLIVLVNACVLGLFVGALVSLTDVAIGWSIAAGVIAGLLLMVAALLTGYRAFLDAWARHRPRRTLDALPRYLQPRARHSR